VSRSAPRDNPLVSEARQFSLLSQRRFAPFFATQFLGACNDHVLRNGLVLLVMSQGVRAAGLEPAAAANLAGGLFILPFFLFSAMGGQLAAKYEKSLLIRRLKLLELAFMLLAASTLLAGSYEVLLLVLFLMGIQSALFGPVRYAYLPQHLASEELIGGNALVESGTWLAILLGLLVGGLAATGSGNAALLASCLVGVAALGYFSSRGIPLTRAVAPDLKLSWNVWRETWRSAAFARRERSVFLSVLGISWFWFFGAALSLQIPAFAFGTLNGGEQVTTVMLAAFAVGIGAGSVLCEKMSGRRIELGLVPFGSIGLSVFAVDLYFAHPAASAQSAAGIGEFLAQPGSFRVLLDLTLLGVFGAVYSVPLYALIQERAERLHLSRIVAANNILNALFMVCAAVLAMILFRFGVSVPQWFLVLALLNGLVAVYIYTLLPEFLIRFLAWILVNTLYRIRASGLAHVPKEGPAVLVCNHVSFADALIIGGTIHRPARFVMHHRIFEIPILKMLFSSAKAIPIASAKENESLLDDAFDQIDAELASGNLVCIFPEGAITTDGRIHRFRPGIEAIIERRPVPVIPIALCGMWGSWFSRMKGGGVRRIPGRLFARITLRIGSAVPPAEVSAAGLESIVRALRGGER
jgi:1-acyl-sn-glycerol-3-phosphate acyltransferase